MSKSNYAENAYLLLVFNGIDFDGIAQNADEPQTHLTVALHTADPGEGGDQSQDEIVYTGYQRVSVVRDATGWLVSGSNVWPVQPITFDEMLGGPGGIVTHASVGTGLSNRILYSGEVTPNINVITNVTPVLKGFSNTPPSVITEE